MLEFLEKIFGEFLLPYNTKSVLYIYGWVIMFIPTLLIVLNKDVETFFYGGFISQKMRKLGYIHNWFAFLFIVVWCCFTEKRLIPDAKLFLAVDTIFWIVHIWGNNRMECAEFDLTHGTTSEEKKQEEEKEQIQQNEIR